MSEQNDEHAGTFDMDDAFDPETMRNDKRKVKFKCPFCNCEQSPLVKERTKKIKEYYKWVGFSHKEPYFDFETICENCSEKFTFSIFYPQ
jgi:hypothetical protein